MLPNDGRTSPSAPERLTLRRGTRPHDARLPGRVARHHHTRPERHLTSRRGTSRTEPTRHLPEDVGTRKAVLPPPHVPEPPDSRVGHRHPLRAPEHVPRSTDPATVTAPLNSIADTESGLRATRP